MDNLEADIAEQRSGQAASQSTAEQRFKIYFELRKAIAGEFAAFVTSNPYLWEAMRGKEAYYKRWQVVEKHHPDVDELVNRLTVMLADSTALVAARSEAMDLVEQYNNWDKNPAPK